MNKIRKNTIKIIERFKLPLNLDLPNVDISIKIKGVNQIANRIDILHLFYAIYSEGIESKDFFKKIIFENNLKVELTNQEKEILEKELTSQNLIDFSWYKESIYSLLWCLGIVQNLYDDLDEINIADLYNLISPEKSREKFISSIQVRTNEELIQAIDVFYNLHWGSKRIKNNILKSVISERRKALEWFCSSENWSEINLDT